MKIQFADCTLDLAARQLVRGGDDAHLPPKAFELLKLLIENRPRVLSKTELIEHVWPGVRRACPDAHLTLVGAGPGESLRRMAQGGGGVTLTGRVPDVRP